MKLDGGGRGVALLISGSQVGSYTIVGRIGTGGMAAVYVVRRTGPSGFEKLLAMKLMLPHLAEEERFVGMFLDEIRIASRIDHPNVVSVIDAGEHDGSPWMVMELLRGKNLAQLLRKTRPPTSEALSIVEQAATGLHAAHECRSPDGKPLMLVHRDFTPQNLHVSYDGVVKVVDFGIATAVGRLTTTQTGEMKGKLAYVAPEQIGGRAVDRRTDVWALGVVAWETLIRQRLFAGKNDAEVLWNVMHKSIPRVRSLQKEVSNECSDMIAACLEREPNRRPPTAVEVASVLGRAAIYLGGSPRSVGRMIEDLFGSDRITEEERLAAAQRDEPADILLTGTPSSVDAIEVAPSASEPRRIPWAVVIGVAVAIGGIGVGIWGATRAPSPTVSEAPAFPRVADPSEPAAPEPDEANPDEANPDEANPDEANEIELPSVVFEAEPLDAGSEDIEAPDEEAEVVHRMRRDRRRPRPPPVDPLRAPDDPF